MSGRHGKLIFYNQFTFHKKHVYGDNTYWICSKYNTLKCLVHLKTRGNLVVHVTGVHNHPPPVLNKDYRYQ